MRELCDGPGLAPKALDLVGLVGHLPMHYLDRDPPLEGLVPSEEDRRHPAAAKLRFEPIATGENRPDKAAREPGCRFLGHPMSIFDTHLKPRLAGRHRARPC